MSAPAKMFETDPQLQRILSRIAPQAARRWHDHLARFGAWVAADVEPQTVYTDAAAPPFLVSFDRAGTPVNDVRTNPLWDAVSRGVYERGIVGLNYGPDPAPFAITFAMGYLLAQADLAVHCPATMTGAVAYVLSRFAPDGLRDRYLGRLTAMDGTALTGGTWATELHGGSDVGATTTTATPAGSHVLLDGLKCFTSNPVGGLAVATARPVGAGPGPRGLGLYLVPYTLEDGSENPMRIWRLKDKLGTRGVPTAEIELVGTRGFEIAAPPDGLRLMMEAWGSRGCTTRWPRSGHSAARSKRSSPTRPDATPSAIRSSPIRWSRTMCCASRPISPPAWRCPSRRWPRSTPASAT